MSVHIAGRHSHQDLVAKKMQGGTLLGPILLKPEGSWGSNTVIHWGMAAQFVYSITNTVTFVRVSNGCKPTGPTLPLSVLGCLSGSG